jgi:hypothetical protein
MLPLTLDNLKQHLVNKKLEPQLQPDTDQVFIIFRIASREFPLFFRIYAGGDLLQMLAFIPCMLKPTAINDLARLLHMLNKELDIPGFGVDEVSGVIFYRIMLPASHHEIDPDVVDTLIQSIRNITETFAPVIAAVASGSATFEDVLKKVQAGAPKPPQKG